ncbi:HYD1 signature containing ADP-ribosyltransferase family protein [Streptomyces sp. NPDC028722]|uniref:HYD1 signature containing ADP-ribosyltransferase family protein n=1 Tax=Streptomyces sp. NPDC028722 TaxID=3155016 RepID=UPI0033CDC2A5
MPQNVDDAAGAVDHPAYLFHYTTEEGQRRILESRLLLPSLRSKNSKDARHGDGQYLTDIAPGSLTGSHLSQALVRIPYCAAKFTHFIQIETTGLTVRFGRAHVYVVPGTDPLDLTGRIKDWGMN